MLSDRHFHRTLFRTISRAATAALAIAIIFALTVVLPQSAQAQTYQVLYTFTGGADGAYPYAGLTMDRVGNLYGTTQFLGGNGCGGFGCGTVFRLKHAGANRKVATFEEAGVEAPLTSKRLPGSRSP
jgi:hypothetical protein